MISLLQLPPAVWFLISVAGIAYLLRQAGSLSLPRCVALVALLLAVTVPSITRARNGSESYWSPYYAVEYQPHTLSIFVNNIGHQAMVPFDTGGSSYSLIHLLQKAVGGLPFKDALIIGAGSGNDINHALRNGVRHIDAVEIDPVIQSIGTEIIPTSLIPTRGSADILTTAGITCAPPGTNTTCRVCARRPSGSPQGYANIRSRATCLPSRR